MLTPEQFDRERHVSPREHDPRCECGHLRSEHDIALFGAKCHGVDPDQPEWVRIPCKCREFRERREGQ